jgi:PAS domain S-box-containing protein
MLAVERQLSYLLDTLPDALIFADHKGMILYANEKTATIVKKKKGELLNQVIWQCMSELATPSLYRAFYEVLRTRKSLQIEYYSPIIRIWFHMHLLPTSEGVSLYFHEMIENVSFQNTFCQEKTVYSDMPDSLDAGVAFLTPEGILLDINRAPLEYAQVQLEDVVGLPFEETIWWSYSQEMQHQLRIAIEQAAQGEVARFEVTVCLSEVQPRILDITITPYKDVEGRVEYLIYSGMNVTRRKQAEEEFRTLAEAMPQFVWIVQPDGFYSYCNQQLIAYTGQTLEKTCRSKFQHIHPDDQQMALQKWELARQTGSLYETEMRIRSKETGEYRWFLSRAVPLKDEHGTVPKWLGTSTDIHEKKQSEEKFRLLAESIPNLVWIAQPDGSHGYCNQQWLDYTGLTLEQVRNGDDWSQCIHPDDVEEGVKSWRAARQAGDLYEVEWRVRNGKTGEYRWFLVRSQPLKDAQGRVLQWFGTCTDIHEKKQLEAALRVSEVRFRALFESNMLGVVIADEQGQIFEANNAFLQLTGYTREALQAGEMTIQTIIAPEFQHTRQQMLAELKETGISHAYERAYQRKDGSTVPVLSGIALLDEAGDKHIGFVLDITDRKELERRKDEFISIASHELKTPLTVLKLLHSHLLRKLTREGYQESIQEIARMDAQITTLTRLINDLLDVSKIQMGKFSYIDEPLDLDCVVREIVNMSQQVITTHTIYLHGVLRGQMMADRDRLEQVITNLLYNAVKYSPQADKVDIFLSQSEKTTFIKVQDYGVGIAKEHQRTIFERFNRGVYGSREQGFPGLGMGLYIAHEVVKQYGGDITVESEMEKGTTFVLSLPYQGDGDQA